MIHVPRASVGIIGGIQPGILRRAIGREHMQDGLCARLLLTMPAPRQVRWTEATIDPRSEAAMIAVFDRLLALESAADDDGKPMPFDMAMTAEAKATWVTYFNRHRAEMTDLDDDLAAAWSKLEAYAARFALVVQLCSWAAGVGSSEQVDQASVESGVALSDWFGAEARRVYDVLSDDIEAAERRELVEWIAKRGGSVTARELQGGLRAYRASASDADAALTKLVECGHGAWHGIGAGSQGGRAFRVFKLSAPSTVNGTPAKAASEQGSVGVDTVDDSIDDVNRRFNEAADANIEGTG